MPEWQVEIKKAIKMLNMICLILILKFFLITKLNNFSLNLIHIKSNNIINIS